MCHFALHLHCPLEESVSHLDLPGLHLKHMLHLPQGEALSIKPVLISTTLFWWRFCLFVCLFVVKGKMWATSQKMCTDFLKVYLLLKITWEKHFKETHSYFHHPKICFHILFPFTNIPICVVSIHKYTYFDLLLIIIYIQFCGYFYYVI